MLDNIILRIRGKIKFSVDKHIKQRIIDNNELVRLIYQTGSNPPFEIFYIEEGESTVSYLDNKTTEYFTIDNK
ncbi:hypothetical protein ABEX55_16165 [Priestia endophytica]|uniref:hypothetical protein n=1 Tax=Priestia endophytica TaxID=135735 RepID=UPI003D2DBCFD